MGPAEKDPGPQRGIPAHRLPDVHLKAGDAEVRGQHAGDLHRLPVELHAASHHRAVAAEDIAPGAIAQHCGGRPVAGPGFRVAQRPAQLGPHAQHVEEVAGDILRGEQARLPVAGQRGGPVEHRVGRDVAEDAGLLLPVEVVGRSGLGLEPVEVGVFFPEHDETVGVGKRQRAQHHRAHRREDRGVGADRERQGEDRRTGERGTPPQGPQGKAQVVPQVIQPFEQFHPAFPPLRGSVELRAGFGQAAARAAERFGARRGWGKTSRYQVLDVLFEDRLELGVRVRRGAVGAVHHQLEQPADPGLDLVRTHRVPGDTALRAFRIAASAATELLSAAVSARSCTRPAGVRL